MPNASLRRMCGRILALVRSWRRAAPLLVFLLQARAAAQPATPAPTASPAATPAPRPVAAEPPDGGTSEGLPGLAGVVAAFDDEPGTVRATWRATYFDAPDFGESGVDLTGLGSSLAIGWSPLSRLGFAIQGAGTSHHGEGMVPGSVQALGDMAISAAWIPLGDAPWRAGGRAGVLLFAGDEPFAYGDSLSPFADVIGSARTGPVRFSANLGYVDDRSEEAIPSDAVLSPPLRAAYGVADGPCARAAVVVSAPLLNGRLEPFAAVKSRMWFGDVKKGDTVLGSGGFRLSLGPADRRLAIEAGVDLSLVPGEDAARRPLEPPMRMFAGLSLVLPPARPSGVVTRVEVPMPPPPPTTGDVEGLVRDGRSGEPLAWVIVDVPGFTQNPILSDAGGVYRVKGIPAGAAKVRVQKQGYAVSSLPVEIKAGAVTTADATLEPTGAKTTGVFAGDVRGRDGKPVAAKITFQFGSESRTVAADATGKFQVSLPSGSFSLKVEAPGFIAQSKTLSVAAGEQTVFNFVLQPVQP